MQLEPEDLGVKVLVPAKTPLLASMGRWVILSNSNNDIRNSVEKRENKDESTDRDVHRQTTSLKARSQHVSPDSTLRAGGERRACDDENTGG